jgi:flagellar hook-basal body complex protein FliE
MSGLDIGGAQGLLGALTRPRLLGDMAPAGSGGEGAPKTAASGFGDALYDALGRVNQLQQDVRAKAQGIMTGEPVELHELMTSIGKSEVAFNLMLEVRNKLVDAWDKISRAVV